MKELTFEERIDAFKKLIDGAKAITFFGGAGVSTASGIPDFRSKDGLYNQHDVRFDAYQPEYLLSHDCLEDHPEVFYEFNRQKLDCRTIRPNIVHYKLAELEQQGKLKAVITQNIDGLHQKAGSRTVYEIHGTMERMYCDRCGKQYPPERVFDSEEAVPRCSCGGKIRPDVTLYGEMLPDEEWAGAITALQKSDLLIVAGTSMTVYPAASLVGYFRGSHLVVLNRDRTSADSSADLIFREDMAKVFELI